MPAKQSVEVEGRRLALSNLDKVLYPETRTTKGEVIDYYARIAPYLLPHLADRPMSFKRFPDGVEGQGFFAKNSPRGTPEWVRTVTLPVPGSTKDRETIDFVVIGDLPTLIWAANLAALELHVPQWTVGPRGAVRDANLLVLDLDPGAPATIVECAQVALMLRALLQEDGLEAYPKTSGSKGMQVYVPLNDDGATFERTKSFARTVAELFEREAPDLVVARMTKSLRRGKVLIDWSQNDPRKSTICAYSTRGREEPTVSTPVCWEEVDRCVEREDAGLLRFTMADVIGRVDRDGDPFAGVLSVVQRLP
jgi:bifunctional non-homologous end joining protein LigD